MRVLLLPLLCLSVGLVSALLISIITGEMGSGLVVLGLFAAGGAGFLLASRSDKAHL